MKNSLMLNAWGTKAVLSRHGLTPTRRIGRGRFCAVYEEGEEHVWKLTSSAIQHESVRDYFAGDHLPRLTESLGCVGEQDRSMDLFLFKTDRLKPLKHADKATRRMARMLIDKCSSHTSEYINRRKGPAGEVGRYVADILSCDEALPLSLREALEVVSQMCGDYGDIILDVHSANLMVREGSELILNDIVLTEKERRSLWR